MTSPDVEDVGPALDRKDAAVIVEQALLAIFAADVVSGLREDSPLTALGMTDADAVCVADAVMVGATAMGWTCVLGDADLAGATAVADIIDAVARCAAQEPAEGASA